MRRYILNKPLENLPQKHFDVVIVGGGLSGLYCALQLSESLSVALVVKSSLPQCNSSLAQGGIAAAVDPGDSPDLHFRDSLKAAAGAADASAVRLMVEKGPEEIRHLARLGVPFDLDHKGNFLTTCEGAHRRKRILHCGGDATGRLIMETLIRQVKERANIQVFEKHFLTDVLSDKEERVAGVVAFHDGFRVFSAPRVVIATGGIGGVYQFSTNDPVTTGDGIAAALRAGAQVKDMQFVQFHPTAFYNPENKDSLFLISEAVRGEGGLLRNSYGDAFMEERHKLKDLAPRDIVAREIFRQMQVTGQKHVYLDITLHNDKFLQNRFPTIYKHLLKCGLRMEEDLIPVVPAQHYFMGGIKTNQWGQSSLHGLYCCGEAACTGVHGGNRLASNSLLECAVFASRIAKHIHENNLETPGEPSVAHIEYKSPEQDTYALLSKLRQMMQDHGGIVREPDGLVHALDYTSELLTEMENRELNREPHFELLNLHTVAREILVAALGKRESEGAHYLEEEVEDTIYTSW